MNWKLDLRGFDADHTSAFIKELMSIQATKAHKLLMDAVVPVNNDAFDTVRDVRAKTLEEAIRGNGRLDVLELIQEPGFGLIAPLEAHLKKLLAKTEEGG